MNSQNKNNSFADPVSEGLTEKKGGRETGVKGFGVRKLWKSVTRHTTEKLSENFIRCGERPVKQTRGRKGRKRWRKRAKAAPKRESEEMNEFIVFNICPLCRAVHELTRQSGERKREKN